MVNGVGCLKKSCACSFVLQAGNTPGHYTSYASVKTLLESHIGAKSEPKLASQQETTQALALTAEAARSSELPISNSYAATQAASTKADKVCHIV